MNSFVSKAVLWSIPFNLIVSFLVGRRELDSSQSQIASEFEALGLALLICLPLVSGWLIYQIFPANRNKLRSFIRFLSVAMAVVYAPLITWLNIDSLLYWKPLEEGFQVYVLPLMFGFASLLFFLFTFMICLMFTNKQPSYGGFD